MATVTFRGLVPDDSPIYEQPLFIGARKTTSTPMAQSECEGKVKDVSGLKENPVQLDLSNLPFDPAKVAGESSLVEDLKNRSAK
jgi:hypothetical protein